jgi:hypothetical protein
LTTSRDLSKSDSSLAQEHRSTSLTGTVDEIFSSTTERSTAGCDTRPTGGVACHQRGIRHLDGRGLHGSLEAHQREISDAGIRVLEQLTLRIVQLTNESGGGSERNVTDANWAQCSRRFTPGETINTAFAIAGVERVGNPTNVIRRSGLAGCERPRGSLKRGFSSRWGRFCAFAVQAFLRGQLALLLLNDLLGPGKFKGRPLVVARKAAC